MSQMKIISFASEAELCYNVCMAATLKLQLFIRENPDWETELSAAPYWIKIKRDDGYILFCYDQTVSDFSNPIVQECRGLILRESDFEAVCVPFFKFFNAGEPNAHQIDWDSAVVQEKLDGSLVKVWHGGGKWRVSTNKTIDAYKATLDRTPAETHGFYSFGELFRAALDGACPAVCGKKTKNTPLQGSKNSQSWDAYFEGFDKNCTYMFELTSKFNKVIVPYNATGIWHIGTRNNRTLQEFTTNSGFAKPKTYPLKTLDDCLSAAAALPWNEEGYVVVDKHFNRVKIKSAEYVRVHRLGNNGVITLNRIIDMLRLNEQDEFLSYYPDYADAVGAVKAKIADAIATLQSQIDVLARQTFDDQKHFALTVKELPNSAFYFQWHKNRSLTPKDWLWQQSNDKIAGVTPDP